MATTLADLRAKVSIDGVDKAEKDLKKTNDHTNSIFENFKKGFGAISGALTAFTGYQVVGDVLGFVKDQLIDVMQAGMDQQKIDAQTAAVIKSTGGAAHLTANQIGDMADSLARLTGVSDDEIQSAENILLTFKAIGQKTFPDATKAVLDMSVALHQDLQQSSILVGKALQDPIMGVTALRRVGVQLSQSQVDLVKHFVTTGQTAKAQAVIIGELTSEFGGSAEAAGKTLPGQLAILNVKFDMMKEKIGLAVIPILQSLVEKYLMPAADWLGQHLPAAIETLTGFIDNTLIPAVEGFMNSPFVQTIEGWVTALTQKFEPATDTAKTHVDNTKGSVDELRTAMHLAGAEADDPNFKTHVANLNDELNRTVNKISNGDKTTAVIPALDAYSDRLYRTTGQVDGLTAAQKNNNDQIPGWEIGLMGFASQWDELRTHVHDVINTLGEFKDTVGSAFEESASNQHAALLGMGVDLSHWGFNTDRLWSGIWDMLTSTVKLGIHSVEGVFSAGLHLMALDFEGLKQDWLNTERKTLDDIKQFVNGIRKALSGLPQWLQGASGASGVGGALFGGSLGGAPGKASGGPVSGFFEGAENGPELLVHRGLYRAAPNSYVYNARETREILSGSRGGNVATQGAPISITVNSPVGQEIAREIEHVLRRRDLLHGMR